LTTQTISVLIAPRQIKDYLNNGFGIFKGKDDFGVVINLDNWVAGILRNRR
jgi:hypothetical protein